MRLFVLVPVLCLCLQSGLIAQRESQPSPRSKELLDRYCVTCHSERLETAGLSLEHFVDLGADPLLPNGGSTTPLMAAAGLGTRAPIEEAGTELEAIEAVTFLLELGADIDKVDDRGNTAMHGAAFGHFPKVVELLAERGADPHIWKQQNESGLTPLFIAEGYRRRGFKLSRPTTEAVTRVMLSVGLATDGPRPEIRDVYEKPPKPKKP